MLETNIYFFCKIHDPVVVAQLVERSLPILEVRGSNPVIGKKLFTLNCIEMLKTKKKRPGMAHLKKIHDPRKHVSRTQK